MVMTKKETDSISLLLWPLKHESYYGITVT